MKPHYKTRAPIATVAADVRRLSLKSEIRNPKSEIARASLRRRLQSASCIILLLFFCVSSFARAGDLSSAIEQANKLYEQGKFTEATVAYEKIIADGRVSPALYFNIGNALFKSDRIGRAILNYRLAEQMAPRDPDIRANLRFVRNHVNGA